MKALLHHPAMLLSIRLLLGAVFLVASADKLGSPDTFADSIMNYRMMPREAALAVATILPWLEIVCGFGVMFGVRLRASSTLILLMLLLFTVAVTSAVIRNLDISCGCFTQDPAAHKVGWMKILENIGLMAGAAVVTWFSPAQFRAVPVGDANAV